MSFFLAERHGFRTVSPLQNSEPVKRLRWAMNEKPRVWRVTNEQPMRNATRRRTDRQESCRQAAAMNRTPTFLTAGIRLHFYPRLVSNAG